MKKVWLSALIAVVIVAGSLCYYYYQRQRMRAVKEHVTKLVTPQQSSVVVKASPVNSRVDVFDEPVDPNPLNLDDAGIQEQECCPDEEVNELYDIHTTDSKFIEQQPTQSVDSAKKLTGYALVRDKLIKKHGYSPDIDRYIELTKIFDSSQRKDLPTMLEWARLEVKYNPSDDARDLLNDFEELAANPELVTEFWFE